MSELLNPDGTPVNPPTPPLDAKGNPKKRFEVKMRMHPGGEIEKAIFIDGEKLDWSIDITSFQEACRMGLQYKLAVQKDIAQHFINSCSEVVGRHLTIEDIKTAIKTGWL